ncbi:unnamed protein product [Polarella glacialis]|uniref:Uncharacterized protein n=1 Tax=Polarella glacialis TaxID=89957 RepID=A0A813M2H2_POLGL|nr:unnamed protein product [Polarella glacialis]
MCSKTRKSFQDQYALCYCDNAQGCPSRGGQQRFTLQHAGNLSVPGAVRGVQLLGDVGFATAVLKVELIGEATGIQCCANAVAARVPSGSSRSCAEVLAKDLPAQATFEGCLANGTGCRRMLPYPRSYNLTLALQEARVHRAPVELNISCAALGELDECAAAENATRWPCEVPAGGLRLELPALPASWVGPWRRAVGSSVGAESLAKPAGLNVLMKVVSLASGPEEGSKACNGSADAAVEGLPCQEVACMDDFLARAITPGTYKLCICEPIAVTTPGACQAWYGLGGLDIFGPVPMTAGLLGAAGVAISFELQGFGFSGQDRLASVLSAATGQSACQRSDGLGAVAAQSTVHSPLDWKVNSLSFQIVLGEGMHSLCWLPPGGTPFFVGTAEVAGAASSPGGCAVGPWAKAGNCSASCGAGGELWRRQVLSGSAGCPALNDTRLCFGPPCTSSVSAWHASPEQPRAGAAVKLYISGSDLPAGLRGMLMPAGSDVALRRLQAPDATRSEAQGACLAGGEVAAAAICSGDDSNQVCGFEHCPASAGSYQVCLCVVWDGSKCTGFLPALGQVSVLNPLGTAEDETNGLVVAVVVVAVLFLLGCSVGAMVARLGRVRLLQMCGLRTKVGKVILEGQNGKDAAKPPAAQEQNSEELRGLGSGEPESEPPGETTPRPDPSEEQSGATLPQARAGRDEDDEKEEEEEAGNLEVALPVPPTPPATPPGTGGPPGCVLPAGSNVHLEESSSLEEGQRSRQGSKASNNNSNSSSSNSKSHRSRQGSKGKLRHEARNASRDCVPCPPAPPPPLGAFPMLPMKLPLLPSQLKNDEALSAQRRSLPRTLAPPPRAPLAPPWRSPGGATKVTSEEEAMAKALAVLDAAKQKVREQDEERCGKPACSQSKEEEPEFVADRQGPGQEKDIDKASTLENVPGHLGLSSAEEADEDQQHERQQQRQQQQQEQQQQEQQQHEHQQHARSRAEEKEPDRLQALEEQEKQLGRTGIEEEKERRRLQAREEEREQRSLRELEEQNKRAHLRSLEEQQEQQRLREMEEKENERARLQSLEEQEERRRLRELEEEEENERARLQSLEEQQGQQRLREMEEEENERARLQSLEEEEERRRLREMEEEEEENERARLQRLEEHQGQQRLREMEEEENERARRQSLEEEQGQQRHREMEEEGNERARLQSLEEQQGQQHLREMEEENERARLQSLEKQQGQQHFRELEEENEQHCLQAQKDQKHPLHHRETEELQERRALEMLEDDKKERCREIEEQKEQQCPHPLEAEEEKQQVESIEKEPEHVSVFGVEEQLNFSQTPEAREHQLFTALQEKKERELQQALEEARQQRLRALEEGKGPEDLQALEESQRQRFQALSEDLQRLIALQDQVGRERLQALDVQGQQRLRALEKEKGRERLQALQQKQHQQHSLALEEESERDLLEAHEAKERQSLAALQDEKERELLQALEEARQQRLRALEEGKGPEDLQALEESQRQRLQALDEELQRLIALQDQIERERLQALREEKKQQQFPKSLEVQKEEERPIAVEAELEEQSRLEQLGALEAALEQERLLVAQEEERLRAGQEEQRRAEEAERELELARQREAWEQACLEADDKEEEREHWRRLAEERERFCRQGQQEGRRQLHQQQLKEQRLQQLQQKQQQVLQPRRSAGDNDNNNFNDNFNINNNNRRSAGADSQTTSQAGMPATCTPPPRTSAVKKARDRSITPPPPQHRSGGLSGGSASAASGSGGQHQALDQETAEWAEFARKRRDRPSSRGSADALLPGGARMSIATSDGQSERAGMAFALGQLDMLDFDVRKRVSGTDSKDKMGSHEQTRADLRGKALVDGGTLMLWKSSKAVAEPSGRPSSAKPRPA